MSTKQYVVFVLIVVVSILVSFYSGFFLKKILPQQQPTIAKQQQTFKPNFTDEIIIVSKEKPYKSLILSAFRTYYDDTQYNYTIKAFYFDGTKWTREIAKGQTTNLDIIPKTSIIPVWNIDSDPSYVLKQKSSGEVEVNNFKIKFDAPLLLNEMGIRSSPKYTKFMSESNGTLTVDGTRYDSHVLYSRVYSFNPPESLVYTSDPSGIETEWLAFWDDENNFYSADETLVDNKINKSTYKAHSLGVFKDKLGNVMKSFKLNLIKNGKDKYNVDILENIKKSITVNRLNSVSKAENAANIWFTGQVNGEVTLENGRKIKGVGIFEQISQ